MEIKFSAEKEVLKDKQIYPIPSKKFIPDWFKRVKQHAYPARTIKGCMPVLDSIVSGYLLKLSCDLKLKYNTYNPISKKNETGWESEREIGTHPVIQLDGKNGFMEKKNGGDPLLKIENPWKIKTPPGYSCLFVPPLHREFDYFHILPGIVDTDQFTAAVNFPICINKDKYSCFVKTFEKGLPYVQVIPFKRNDWKMSIVDNISDKKVENTFAKHIINGYKKDLWKEKKYD